MKDVAYSFNSNPELWLNSVFITIFCISIIIMIGFYLPEKYKNIYTKFLGILLIIIAENPFQLRSRLVLPLPV